MKIKRKTVTTSSLVVALSLILILIIGNTLGYGGGAPSANREYDCGGSCHSSSGTQSSSTISMSASKLNVETGEQIFVNVTVSGSEASSSQMGVFLVRNRTSSSSKPSVDGWVIVSDPSGSTAYNYYQYSSVTGGGTWNWTLKAPSNPGTYHLYAREHHGNGKKYWNDDIVGLTFNVTIPADVAAPGKIMDLSAQGPTTTTINLTWSAPGDDGFTGSASGYILKYSTSGEITNANWASVQTYNQTWTPVGAGNGENKTITGLTPDTTYWFAIKGIDEVPNIGEISNSPSLKTLPLPDKTAPSKITDLSVSNPTATSLNLTWTAPGDDGGSGTVSGYYIRYSTTGEITSTSWDSSTIVTHSISPKAAGNTEELTITSLLSNTKYWFAVRAFDETPNIGEISNSPSGTTLMSPDITPPSMVTDLAVGNITTDSVSLTWTAPGDDGGLGSVTGYEVKYSKTGMISETNWLSATTFPQSKIPSGAGNTEVLLITGLIPETEYWFALKSFDEVPNYSNISNSVNATTKAETDTTPPSTITDLAPVTTTNNTVKLSWTAPGDDGNTGTAAGYILKYSSTGTLTVSNWLDAVEFVQSWVPQSSGNSESRTITDLDPGTKYWFAIKAFDEVKNTGDISNIAVATTKQLQVIVQPKIVSGPDVKSVTNDTVVITWTTDVPSNSIVEYGESESYGLNITISDYVTEHNITITGLSKNTVYYYRIHSTPADSNAIATSTGSQFKTLADKPQDSEPDNTKPDNNNTGPDDTEPDDNEKSKDESGSAMKYAGIFAVIVVVIILLAVAFFIIKSQKREDEEEDDRTEEETEM